jgi:uncharacterized protein YbjT (DUF2867 family)
MSRVLVIGGTGMLGRPVAVQLVNDGFDVRVMTTNPKKAEAWFGDRVEIAEGNVEYRQSLINAMDGCEYVYINLKGGPTKAEYIGIEQEGSKNIYIAAQKAGIKKVVQISEARVDETHARFIHHGVKLAAEKALIASGLTYVILKPTWFCESLPLFVQKTTATLIGRGEGRFHFLAVADYVDIVSKCFSTDKADNKILTVFGPELLSMADALGRFLKTVYPEVKISRLPQWLARMTAMFSFNKNLKSVVNLMTFFNKYDDAAVSGDPVECDRLFGPCTITVDQWAEMYRKIIKG